MPNLDLENKKFPIDNERVKHHFNSNEVSYNNATTKKSRLEKKKETNGLTEEENIVLDWLNKKLDQETKRVDTSKRIQRDAGKTNAFKKTHTKDRSNANPTKISGLAKITSDGEHSKTSDQIYNNRTTYYESLEKEIDSIKYLIEYFDNNKKNNII
jgi:hypothetical protein